MKYYKYWSCNDKNKIKLDALGNLLVLETRNRSLWIPKIKKILSSDHDMHMKTYLTLTMILDIIILGNEKLGSFYKG